MIKIWNLLFEYVLFFSAYFRELGKNSGGGSFLKKIKSRRNVLLNKSFF